jgi:hypothetical protein
MNRDAFGLLVEEELRELPPAAGMLLRDVGIVIERRPAGGPVREAEFMPRALDDLRHLFAYWSHLSPPPASPVVPTLTLYIEPILAAGPDARAEIRRVLLRAAETRHRLEPGRLKEEPRVAAWTPEGDAEPELHADLVPEYAPERVCAEIADIAESAIETLPPERRDLLDNVELSVVERPEASGDPDRVADFPEPGEEFAVLVLYARNILLQAESPAAVVSGIVRDAAIRREESR